MGLKASNKGGGLPPIEPGSHAAVCVGYCDLGTQKSEYQGQVKENQKVMIFWDVPDSRITVDGKDLPRRISARYTLSLHPKGGLRKMLEQWLGRKMTREEEASFDLDSLIGKPAMISVVHNEGKEGKIFAAVGGVLPLPKGMPRPGLEVPALKYVCLDDVTGEFVVPGDDVPDWVKKIIAQSYEAKGAIARAKADGKPAPAFGGGDEPPAEILSEDGVPF